MSLQRELGHPHIVGCCPPTFPPVPRILGWASLWTWPGPSSGSWSPILGTRGDTVFDMSSVCVLAAVPSQGELGGRKSSPPEPDPAPEPAEPDASRAELGEQGAVPRGAEAVHVRGVRAPAGTRALAAGATPGVLGARGHASLPAYPLGFPWDDSRFLRGVAVAFVCFSKALPTARSFLICFRN